MGSVTGKEISLVRKVSICLKIINACSLNFMEPLVGNAISIEKLALIPLFEVRPSLVAFLKNYRTQAMQFLTP